MKRLILVVGVVFGVAGCGPKSRFENPAPLQNAPDSIADLEKPRGIGDASSQATEGLDVQKYFLEFAVNPSARFVEAREIVTVSQTQSHQKLQLDAAAQLHVKALAVGGVTTPYVHNGDVLAFDVPKSAQDEPLLEIELQYDVTNPANGFHFAKNEMGQLTQLWTHSEPLEAREWFVGNDRPTDKAIYETRVHTPADWKTLSNGRLISAEESSGVATYHWLMNAPMPTYLFSLVIGPMVVIEDSWRNMPVSYWTLPGMETDTLRTLKRTPEMLEMISGLLVDYPYDKYSVGVALNYGGAMEHTTATSFAHNLLTDDGKDPSRGEVVAVHELAHHWFGDLVTCDTWDHIWLNESFATFFENLYIRHLKGEDYFTEANLRKRGFYFTREANGQADGNNGGLGPIVNYKNSAEQKFNSVSYEKGSQVLNMLRVEMGDAAFFKGLKIYLTRHFMSTAKTSDLQKALEEAYGKSLEGFFQQWVYRAGYPELDVTVGDVKNGKVTVMVKQTQAAKVGVFRFPLKVTVYEDAKAVLTRDLWVAQLNQTFELPAGGQSVTVVVDPNESLVSKQSVHMPQEFWKRIVDQKIGTYAHQIDGLNALAGQKAITFEALMAVVENAQLFEALRSRALALLVEGFGQDLRMYDMAMKFSALEFPIPIRAQAVLALQNVPLDSTQGAEVSAKMAQMLETDISWEVAANAGQVLVSRKMPNAYEALVRTFNPKISERGYLFSSVVKLFGALQDSRAIDLLGGELLKDLSPVTSRIELARGLGAFKDNSAVDYLGQAIVKELTRPDGAQWNFAVSSVIIGAVTRIHTPAAKTLLEKVRDNTQIAQNIRYMAGSVLKNW